MQGCVQMASASANAAAPYRMKVREALQKILPFHSVEVCGVELARTVLRRLIGLTRLLRPIKGLHMGRGDLGHVCSLRWHCTLSQEPDADPTIGH